MRRRRLPPRPPECAPIRPPGMPSPLRRPVGAPPPPQPRPIPDLPHPEEPCAGRIAFTVVTVVFVLAALGVLIYLAGARAHAEAPEVERYRRLDCGEERPGARGFDLRADVEVVAASRGAPDGRLLAGAACRSDGAAMSHENPWIVPWTVPERFRRAPETVLRFAITHVGRGGLRGLSVDNTYPTRESAEEAMGAWLKPHGLPRVLTPEQLATVEVRPCPCYLNRQPVGVFFDWEAL